MLSFSDWLRVVYWVVGSVSAKLGKDDLAAMAAAISYFAFFSVIPLLIVVMWVMSLFSGDSIRAFIVSQLPKIVPVSGELLEELLKDAYSIQKWGFLAILPLAWTGTSLFAIMERAINRIWGFPSKGIWKGRIWGAALVFVLILLVVLQPALLYIAGFWHWLIETLGVSPADGFRIFGSLDRWIVMWAVYFVIYLVAPSRPTGVKYALVSGAVATIGTWLAQWIFVTYLVHGRFALLYRLITDVMFLLLWFYLTAYIILLGAEVGYFLYHLDRGDLLYELEKIA